ncbi:DNA oxidative demethylase AlkB [Sphingobium sp. B12D2B]|uniref:DNA oxidative demethylase AlkB n=1 Tax=Sphingobium sp. B12D2B TaxID=2940577 RepID=UPI002224B10E|nr:DNA oxidative demethylase AlkB [Sphingobium sp. B12D2B]MCW2351725.1 alkylated DNA repair protein (DNA oxidative demethylase) [Sphingobium sp. B12D2B]
MDHLFAFDRRALDLDPGAMLLEGFALSMAEDLLGAVATIAETAPFRHLETPGGRRMSVAMTNTGRLGWVSDRRGYRYNEIDPLSGRPWPEMPSVFADLARSAASAAGFDGFAPEACLVNRYEPGAKLSLHQDRDERNLDQPIVSVSLGVEATFLWGGASRADRARRIWLRHGDVVVWGGPARLSFHGVDTLARSEHPLTGALRYNLTFRRAC